MLVVLIFVILSINSLEVTAKIKSLHCTMFDKEFGEIVLCKVKAINHYRSSISVHYRQNQTASNINVRFEIFKRANGWRPFLYNVTISMCDFLRYQNNRIFSAAFSYLKPYLAENYTCPLQANKLYKCENFELEWNQVRVRFPVETGEYAVQLSFYHRRDLKATFNISSEYSNYKEH